MERGTRFISMAMAVALTFALVAPAISADSDGDGLWDSFEKKYGLTDPQKKDTDRDGVIDSAEDNDGDGLSNRGEQRFKTNPRKRDTDGDGKSDAKEDNNRNGISNGREQDKRKVPADLRPSLGAAVHDFPPIRFKCQTPHGQITPRVCKFGPIGEKRVALFGDSHAMMWSEPVKRATVNKGWRFLTMTKTACPALLGIYTKKQIELDRGYSCQRWRWKVINLFKKNPPDLIIITQSDRYKLYSKTGAVQPSSKKKTLWKQALKRTLDALPKKSRVVVLGDVPHNRVNPRRCLNHNRNDMSKCVTRKAGAPGRQIEIGLRQTAYANGAHFRTLYGKICSYDPCPVVQGNKLIWRDHGHVTNRFAVQLQPAVQNIIEAALK